MFDIIIHESWQKFARLRGEKMRKVKINGKPIPEAEIQIHTLKCLLHYHEAMMFPHQKCPALNCECEHINHEMLEGKCPNAYFIDKYAETLREAIRCI